jgi:hypothetical protein
VRPVAATYAISRCVQHLGALPYPSTAFCPARFDTRVRSWTSLGCCFKEQIPLPLACSAGMAANVVAAEKDAR